MAAAIVCGPDPFHAAAIRVNPAAETPSRHAAARADLSRVTLACAGVTLLVGIDWLSGLRLQERLVGDLETMKLSTALLFTVVATGAWARLGESGDNGIARACGVAAVIGGLLALQPGTLSTDPLLLLPSPATSVLAVALGLALAAPQSNALARGVAEVAAATGSLLGFAGMLGYAVGHQTLYQWGPFSSVSPHTALIGFALGCVLLVHDPRRPLGLLVQDEGLAGVTFRRLAAAVLLLTLWFGVLLQLNRQFQFFAPALDVAFLFACSSLIMVGAVAILCVRLHRSDAAREQALRAHHASMALAHQFLDAAPNALLVVDRDGIIVWANVLADQLFRAASGALPGMAVDSLVPAAARARHGELRAAFEQKRTRRQMAAGRDLEALRLDGTTFPATIGLNPIEHDGRQLVVAAIIDISQHIDNERLLNEHAERLAASNRELELFAVVASHDLQEPLRAIRGFGGRLAEHYRDQLDQRGARWLDYMVDASTRMSTLVQDLLRYSRARTRELELESFEADRALADVLSDLDESIETSAASITSDPLPRLRADAAQFRQLLQNLLLNAIKYCETEPRIRITVRERDDAYEFAVRDNGMGIDPQYHDRVFVAFKRLHTQGTIEGTGVGLALCKTIVERHGGHIWLESAVGAGTTVFFTLPRGTAPEPRATHPPEPTSP